MRSFSLISFILALVLSASFILLSGHSLPPIVASHFTADGSANAFMPRDAYLRLMVFVAVGIPLLLAFSTGILAFVPSHLINLPCRDYWLARERRAETFTFLRNHGICFSVMVSAFLCFVHWSVLQANEVQPPHLPFLSFIAGATVFMVALVLLFGLLLVHFTRRY